MGEELTQLLEKAIPESSDDAEIPINDIEIQFDDQNNDGDETDEEGSGEIDDPQINNNNANQFYVNTFLKVMLAKLMMFSLIISLLIVIGSISRMNILIQLVLLNCSVSAVRMMTYLALIWISTMHTNFFITEFLTCYKIYVIIICVYDICWSVVVIILLILNIRLTDDLPGGPAMIGGVLGLIIATLILEIFHFVTINKQMEYHINYKETVDKYLETSDKILFKDNKFVDKTDTVINVLNDEEQCSICLVKYTDKDNITRLPCGHCYHYECNKDWLYINPTCPHCRKLIIL